MLATLDWPFLARARCCCADRAGIGGAGPAVPARTESGRHRRVSALGLGAERRVFCCGHATGEPDCARGRLQQGSVVRGDPLWRRAGYISRDEEAFGLARNLSTITRRGVISAAASASVLPAAAQRGTASGRRPPMRQAMRESGRPVSLTDAQFDAIQKRKPAAMKRIESYLKEHLGSADPAVMAAFEAVPREYFHYEYPEHRATPGDAYEDNPKPWALGYGSALSDYLGQAYMTQVCKPAPDDVTLEIGTGSGFQSSLLSRIVQKPTRSRSSSRWARPSATSSRRSVTTTSTPRSATATTAGRRSQGGFDIIIVTCAATFAPPDLFKQLKPDGRMIIPIGQPFKRGQVLYVYTKDAEGKIHSRRDIGRVLHPDDRCDREKHAGSSRGCVGPPGWAGSAAGPSGRRGKARVGVTFAGGRNPEFIWQRRVQRTRPSERSTLALSRCWQVG